MKQPGPQFGEELQHPKSAEIRLERTNLEQSSLEQETESWLRTQRQQRHQTKGTRKH